MSGSKSLRLLMVLMAIACLTSPASAGTIRHDGSDDEYITLAGGYPSVGQFTWWEGPYAYSASGVLIDPHWVLTAAHVVDGASSLNFDINGQTYSSRRKSLFAYPLWDGDLAKGYDIGLVKLPQAVQGITPAARYRGTSELGQIGTSVGFGMTGDGVSGAVRFDGQKRAGDNRIDVFYNDRVFLSDFDNPANAGDNWWGSQTPLDLEYLIAPGDSGGGVFVKDANGQDLLAGIHSFVTWRDGKGDSDYGDGSGHTRVSQFNDWINSIIGGGGGGKPKPPRGPKNTGADVVLGGAAVPEPSTLWLLCIAGLCLVGCWWRKRGG